MVVFKDKYAGVGRVKPISHTTQIKATSPSRSLRSLITDKSIKVEILDNGYLILDFSSVIGNKARISRTNVVKLIKWIKQTYDKKEDNKKMG